MRLRTTLALFLLTAGLAWFVARQDFASSGASPADNRSPFSFKRQEVDTIDISGKDQAITLQRRGRDWWITAPFEDRANPLPAEAIAEIFSRLETIETFKASTFSADRIKRAGLNGSSIDLTLSGSGKKLAACKVGSHTALENSVYLSLRHPRDGEVIHAARLPFAELAKSDDAAAKKFDLLTMLRTPAAAWRDPALIRIKADDVRSITFSAGTGLMEFKRDPGQPWRLSKPLQTRASEERVNAVLAALLHIEARPAAKSQDAAAAASAALPGMKVSIISEGLPQPVELSLQAGASADADIVATSSDRPGTFLLPGKAALIWKLQPNDLRDPNLAKIDPKSVHSMRIRSASHPEVQLDRQGETWMLARFGTSAPANQDRVFQLFGELNAAQIREFASDAATNLEPFGLHQPFLELEWKENAKTTMLQFGVNPDNKVFCRFDHEPFIYRINPSLLSAIPADGVKWQGLGVLNLSTLSVRRIIISEGDSPAVTLAHDPMTGIWQGEIAGKDVSGQIQKEAANALLNKLTSLNAETWVTDRTAGYEALKNPALTVQILVTHPSKPDAPPAPRTLVFASTNPKQPGASYYGRLDGNPDLFLLGRDQYREIVAPVVK